MLVFRSSHVRAGTVVCMLISAAPGVTEPMLLLLCKNRHHVLSNFPSLIVRKGFLKIFFFPCFFSLSLGRGAGFSHVSRRRHVRASDWPAQPENDPSAGPRLPPPEGQGFGGGAIL